MPETPDGREAFIDVGGKRMHYTRLGAEFSGAPILFLHEGLGSVERWRTFPADVVAATHHPGLVYSRLGNGRSDPMNEGREPDYMHVEALQILPELVGRLLGVPPILLGHSDGASIAVIYAGSGYPVSGLVLSAPHVFVEPLALESIASIRQEFLDSDMPERMAKYHLDPKKTFLGWADAWLDPAFRSWNIEEYLPGVSCPTFLIQGDSDEYGTVRQLDAIDHGLPTTARRLVVEGAGHSPHLSHPEQVTAVVADFINELE